MDNILLCSNHIPPVTSIHNTFIEKYMLRANGSYVKVYLYLSKCLQSGQDDISISSLADQMENTEKDIIRALNYWEKQGLLRITRDADQEEILGIDFLNPDEETSPLDITQQTVHSAAKEKPAVSAESVKPSPADTPVNKTAKKVSGETAVPKTAAHPETAKKNETNTANTAAKAVSSVGKEAPSSKAAPAISVTTEQTKRLADNDDFCWTCNVVESYLNRPLRPKEFQLIAYLYDNLHFSSDLIIQLYEDCIERGKTSPNYIQAVALSWDEKNVKTPEEAQDASSQYNAFHTAISKALALGRPIASAEKKYIARWQNEWELDLSVILEACDRTILKLHHADFKYTESILSKWHNAKVHTLQDIEKLDEAFEQSKILKMQEAAALKNNTSGIVQHGLSKPNADALEKKLLNV